VNTQRIEQNGFRLVERVDDTSRTVVWKAVQNTLDRTVIIRVLKPAAVASPAEVDHFLTIARLISRIKSESVAAVFDIVSDGDLHYIVMEHVEGPTLEELVVSRGPIPVDQALRIAASLITSLAQLWHSDHIVHRNLKSSTIRLDSRGVAKITDFSLAITAGPGVDATSMDGGHIVGTPCFLSPEQAQGSHLLTTQSDMYALGAVLYHLVTGKLPFEERDVVDILTGHIKHQIPPPHRRNRHVPVSFSWLLHRLMMKNPNNRYADWDNVLQDIRLILSRGEPSCVRPDEEYLSTIGVDSDETATDDADGAAAPRGRRPRKKSSATIAAYQDKHLVDGHANEIRRDDLIRSAVCWGILLAWLALVFWFRAIYQSDPTRADTAHSFSRLTETVTQQVADSLDDLKALAERSATEEPAPDLSQQPPPPPQAAPDTGTDTQAAQAPSPTPPPVMAPAKPTPVPPAPPAADPLPSGIPESLRQSLAHALALGDLAAARQAVNGASESFREKADLQKLLAETPDPDSLVADYLKKQIGRPLLFEYNGKTRTVIPQDVKNNTIHLESNGRGADVAINQLSADSKLQWMDRPKDAAQCLAYCLTLMRSARRAEVPAQAADCPLLTEVIVRAAAYVPAATPPAE
jgi:serine/threonine protein kinase